MESRNHLAVPAVPARRRPTSGEDTMKGILLWLLGIPIPIIIALYLFGVF
jgi:hypothetical protein